jgi:2-oxoglutarate dehydrogenase E2 component (dihydrolipoamide succinyltransferase)
MENHMSETPIEISEDLVGDDGEAELAQWLVADGGQVERDGPVVELSTSKAIVEVLAPAAGTLKRRADVGDIVVIGQVIATISHAG